MNSKINRMALILYFMISSMALTRGQTLLSDSFDGVEGTEITSLGWVRNGGNATDKLSVDSSWQIDGGGQAGKGTLTSNQVWLRYSKTLPTVYTLGEHEAVVATISCLDGVHTSNKFTLIGDTSYTISRSLGDQPSNAYTCFDSQNVTFGTSSVTNTWYNLYNQPTYYKIVASRNEVQFFFKDAVKTSWTHLGTSPSGITFFRGILIGGSAVSGNPPCIVFDSLNVSVDPQLEAPAFTPGGRYISGLTAVTITSSQPGASIYYTIDGSFPTSASTLYTGPVTVEEGTTLKAVAVANGYVNSSITSVTYSIPSDMTLMSETFEGTTGTPITSLGWVKDSGNADDKLSISSDWPIDGGCQAALGDVARNGVWLTYSKSLPSAYTLADNDVVTITTAFRDGLYTSNKFVLVGDASYTISRSLGDQSSNGYSCFNAQNASFGTSSVMATWWQLYDQPAYYKIVASRNWVRFYFKDVNHSQWTLLGTSPNGINTITGIQIGGMATSGSWSYVEFDSINISVAMARGNTLFAETFDGVEGTEITSLGWIRQSGNAGDSFLSDSSWPIDGGGQAAKEDLTPNQTWLTYSKTFPAYALAERDVLTAVISFRDGIHTANKFTLLCDTNTFTISRSLGDQLTNGYDCFNSQNQSFGTSSVKMTWWQLYDQVGYYKIVATRTKIQFYFKDVNHPQWTLLGTSAEGINIVTGVQIGGMANPGNWSFVEFDSIDVSILGEACMFEETFSSATPLAKWTLHHFSGTASFTASTVNEGNNQVAQLMVSGNGAILDTFYTSLPDLTGTRGKLRVDFRYKSTKDLPLTVALSGGLGFRWPSIHYVQTAVPDGQWHESSMVFDVTGMSTSDTTLEFIVDCSDTTKAVNGDTIQLDDIRVTRLFTTTPSVIWRSPGSHVLIGNMSSQVVVLDLVNPTGDSCTFNVTISSLQGSPVYQTTTAVINSKTLQIDAASFPVGAYEVSVTASGLNLGRWSLKKYASNPNAVFVQNGIPYVNGEPYLVLGLFHTGDRTINKLNDEVPGTLSRAQLFQDVVNRGFNSVFYTWGVAPLDFYQLAAQYNLMVLSESNGALNDVATVKDQPNVLGWYGSDEPYFYQADACADLYEAYKELDPYHPLFCGFCRSGLGYGSRRLVDIALPDGYPFSSSTVDFGNTIQYHMETNRNVLLDNDPTTCVIAVPQLFTADGLWNDYEPTYTQVRAEVYGSIYYGAKGFFYYAYLNDMPPLSSGMPSNPSRKYWYLPESPLWNQVGMLNQELIALKDVILLGQPDTAVSVTSSSGSILGRGVITPSGQRYVLIVNTSSVARTGIQIQGLTSAERLERQFNSPAASVSGTQWTVNLPGYGVGVYFLTALTPGDANGDGVVDVGDLGVLAGNYGTTNGMTWSQGDFNGDGAVDIADLGIIAANYGSGSNQLPEFSSDYDRVFGKTVTEEEYQSSICSGFGLPLLAGFFFAGLMLVKHENVSSCVDIFRNNKKKHNGDNDEQIV